MSDHHSTNSECPSELCDEKDECRACDGSGQDLDRGTADGCMSCDGTGRVTPEHCCACGGSPYCQCCRGCGKYAGTCGCPQPVAMQDRDDVRRLAPSALRDMRRRAGVVSAVELRRRLRARALLSGGSPRRTAAGGGS